MLHLLTTAVILRIISAIADCVTQPWNLLGSLSKITVRTTHPEHLEKGEEVSRDEARKIDRSKLHSKW